MIDIKGRFYRSVSIGTRYLPFAFRNTVLDSPAKSKRIMVCLAIPVPVPVPTVTTLRRRFIKSASGQERYHYRYGI